MSEPVPPNYYTNVIADRWLHAEIRLISFKRLTLPESSPQPTAPRHSTMRSLRPFTLQALGRLIRSRLNSSKLFTHQMSLVRCCSH